VGNFLALFAARPDPSAPGLTLLRGDPGNALLSNGVMQTANREKGVPGFPPQVPTAISEFGLMNLLSLVFVTRLL
jgi:hypothetical protein